MMEAASTSEIFFNLYHTTRRNIPEDSIFILTTVRTWNITYDPLIMSHYIIILSVKYWTFTVSTRNGPNLPTLWLRARRPKPPRHRDVSSRERQRNLITNIVLTDADQDCRWSEVWASVLNTQNQINAGGHTKAPWKANRTIECAITSVQTHLTLWSANFFLSLFSVSSQCAGSEVKPLT
jgi:hypothetical protein